MPNAVMKDEHDDPATVEIRDWSLWIKHIHGDRVLISRLKNLREGQRIQLRVDGHEGVWVKKNDGKDGRPTEALKPIGDIKSAWFDWFKHRRGELVSIELAGGGEAQCAVSVTSNIRELEQAAPSERAAAWKAFTALRNAGWRSESDSRDRDELHER